MPAPELERFEPKTRAEWRAWLAKHHTTSPGVWLVSFKKSSGKARLTYDDFIEEALCFGWIDSIPRPLDAERTMLKFSPRKARSVWSKLNKERVARLIANGVMTPAGQATIDLAKKNGSWKALDKVDRMVIPLDLRKALAANPDAKRHFDAFPPSSKKIILTWIFGAKRPVTRANRVAETVRLAAVNRRANHYRE